MKAEEAIKTPVRRTARRASPEPGFRRLLMPGRRFFTVFFRVFPVEAVLTEAFAVLFIKLINTPF
jgi:hypothetical protein